MRPHDRHGAADTPPVVPDRLARLPLRAELYLIAHDDDRGACHLHPQTLALGLAGAILLELWLAQRVAIGWAFDAMTRRWLPAPGRLTIVNPDPLGDPLPDAAVAAIRHTGRDSGQADQLRRWLRGFAAADLYERVRAGMVAVGLLRHSSRRRYGLARTDRYVAADGAWAVRARARVRSAVARDASPYRAAHQPPDPQCVALCGLVRALELESYLYSPDMSAGRLRRWLDHIVGRCDRAIVEVSAAVDAGRGDLAVTALR